MNQTSQLSRSMVLAARLAPSLGHSQVVPAHLLLVLLEDTDISFLLNAYGVDIKQAKTSVLKLFPKITPSAPAQVESVPVSAGLNSVMAHAQKAAQKNKLDVLDSTFMFATLLREEGNFSKVLQEYDLSYDSVTQFIQMQTGSNISIDPVPNYIIDDAAYLPPPPKPATPVAAPMAAPVTSPPPAQKNPAPAPAPKNPESIKPPAQPANKPLAATPRAEQPKSVPKQPSLVQSAPTTTMPAQNPPAQNTPTAPAQNPLAQPTPSVQEPSKDNNEVISFSNILRRNSAATEDNTVEQPGTPPQNAQTVPTAQPVKAPEAKVANNPPIAKPKADAMPAIPQQAAQQDLMPAPAPAQTSAPTQPVNSTVSATGSVIEKGILVVPQLLTMEIGKPQNIDVRIARNPQARISNNNSYDKVVMEALTTQLHAPGQNFHIKSLLPETHWIDHTMEQSHNTADYGQWKWEVTPLQRGATKLSLVVSSRTLNPDNQLSSITLPEKSIEVKVGLNIMSLLIKGVMLAGIVALTVTAALLLPKFM